jgi:hypothetical protein
MRKKKPNWLKDFVDHPMTKEPCLKLNQPVKVIDGKHKGTEGNVYFYRTKGDGGRVTLLLKDGSYIYVDKDEIDYKFEMIEIIVMMDEEERTAFKQRIKDYEEGYS